MSDQDRLTERQQKWFATVLATLERESGKSLQQWAELARACPEEKPARRLAWMKSQFGLGRNQASLILDAAFPPDQSWATPEALEHNLWRDDQARSIFRALQPHFLALPDVVIGQRKGFSAYSRHYQFAALRALKQAVLLGLALPPDQDQRLQPAGKEAWSERLKSKILISSVQQIDAGLVSLIGKAWSFS
jgi:hypothetical protein